MKLINISWSKDRFFFFIFSCIGLLVFAFMQLHNVRIFIIWFTENIALRRHLEDPAKWHNLMRIWSIRGIVFCTIIIFCILFWKYLKQVIELISQKFRLIMQTKPVNSVINSLTAINYKQFIKPVLIMFGIYALGISAIIRADLYYIDDINRSLYGYRVWENWSRYISSFLAIFIHTNTQIDDISPLTQLIAVLLIAASSVTLVYVINDKKITKTALAVSLPVGLSPYFLQCFSYKFDSPYMALSVFASIIPFIFADNYKSFSIASVIGLLIMCMTYQASSGIYIIIVIMLCFRQWNTRQKTNREILTFLGISIISYCIVMILFKIFFAIPVSVDSYASTAIYPLSQMISGIMHNIINYYKVIINDFGMIWKVLLLLLIISFWVKSIITSKQHKRFAFLAGFIVIALIFVLSFGVYLILIKPLYAPRGMYG